MENRVESVVHELLLQIGTSKGFKVEEILSSQPDQVIKDSLDQMRFLVALEEKLGIFFDDVDVLPFSLSSRPELVQSVERMLETVKTVQ